MRQGGTQDDNLGSGRQVTVDIVDLIFETLVQELITSRRQSDQHSSSAPVPTVLAYLSSRTSI